MPPRTLQSILAELDTVYNPQIDSIRQKQAAIPGQVQAEEQGLAAKQEQAYGDILNGARRRGTGVAFGGIPLAEQARYNSTEYMPALARMKQGARDQATSLEDAILGIQERRMGQGQSIYQFEQQAAEQRRQFDQQMAESRRQAAAARAQASSFAPSIGFSNVGAGSSALDNRFARQKQGGGFEFVDQNGQPISAAAYAVATGVPFRTVLQRMAEAGDGGAKAALNFVGNDFGYDRAKVNSQNQAGLYNALTWGVRPGATVTPLRLANDPRF